MLHMIFKQETLTISSIVGFEKLQQFRLEEIEPGSQFAMLQSVEDPHIGFAVVSPFDLYPDYEFTLNDEIIESLGINKAEDVAVYAIITLKQPFINSTVNLVAPIVINAATCNGKQFIINNSGYSIHAPLFPSHKGGE